MYTCFKSVVLHWCNIRYLELAPVSMHWTLAAESKQRIGLRCHSCVMSNKRRASADNQSKPVVESTGKGDTYDATLTVLNRSNTLLREVISAHQDINQTLNSVVVCIDER